MRVLLFVLTFVSTAWAVAAQPVIGTLVKSGSDVFLQSNDHSCPKYRIETKSDDAMATLFKLSSGDSVTATGLFDASNCIAVIESIDYVGLKRLLGNWVSKEGLISVHDFTTMSFYSISGINIKSNSQASLNYGLIKPVQYKYSVTPSDGKEWVLFLSDEESTTFATIQFTRDIAIMKIYDSDDGSVKKVMVLSRRGILN